LGRATRLYVIVDNRARPGLWQAWGLSILAETASGGLVLFDTGPDGETLCYNARVMGVEHLLSRLDAVVISHPHRDHYGGLGCVAHHSPGATVVLPPVPAHLVSYVRRLGLAPVLQPRGVAVAPGALATTPLEAAIGLQERALAVETGGGLPAVLLGCSHPGGDRLVETALQETGAERAALAIGGLHEPPPAVVDRIAEMAERIAPIHCSGSARDYAARTYPGKYVDAPAGTVLEL